MRTRYGTSPWVHEYPRSRRPAYPRLRGGADADVAIIGGGTCGCLIAYFCAAAGLKPLLLEAAHIGGGRSGLAAGLLSPEPGPLFREVSNTHGLRAARQIFQIWGRSAREAAALFRRFGLKPQPLPEDVHVVDGGGGETALRREADARSEAGLDARWLTPRQRRTLLHVDRPAFRAPAAFGVHPYRAAIAVAAAAARRGARLFERSPVTRVRPLARHAEVIAEGGVVRCRVAVVATGMPGLEFKPLRRHFAARERYLVVTERLVGPMRADLPAKQTGLHFAPPSSATVRHLADDRLLVTGADQAQTPERTREAVLTQRTGQLMYELLTIYPAISGLRPEYGWHVPYSATADGLMYIGAHRNYPRHLFALGGDQDFLTEAFVAARILVRALRDAPEKTDALWGWTR